MKVAIVGSAGVPANYGGFETLAEQLASENERRGVKIDFSIYCSSRNYAVKKKQYLSAELRYVNLPANGIWSIAYDMRSLLLSVRHKDDVILLLGVSGAVILPVIKIISKSKIITNLDGVESRRDKWSTSAKLFLKISEWFAVTFSDEIISDNEGIARYIEDRYQRPSNVIAYGGNHAISKNIHDVKNKFSIHDNYYLSICRIEPENNIELILESFSVTKKTIVIIGNWFNSKFGQVLYDKFISFDNIFLLEPVYDIDLLSSFRYHACGYVHGHSAGGTNPSLVEALFYEMPMLCFDCDFNRFTTFNRANYFCTAEDLIDLIADNRVTADPELVEKANEAYTWKRVYDEYIGVFTKALKGSK